MTVLTTVNVTTFTKKPRLKSVAHTPIQINTSKRSSEQKFRKTVKYK